MPTSSQNNSPFLYRKSSIFFQFRILKAAVFYGAIKESAVKNRRLLVRPAEPSIHTGKVQPLPSLCSRFAEARQIFPAKAWLPCREPDADARELRQCPRDGCVKSIHGNSVKHRRGCHRRKKNVPSRNSF